MFGGIADLEAIRGGAATARVLAGASFQTRRNQIFADYAAAPSNNQLVSGGRIPGGPSSVNVQSALDSWNSAQNAWIAPMAQLAQSTLIQMANQDTPLAQLSVANAMALLIQQMKASASTVQASLVTVGAQTAYPGTSPVGNGNIVISTVSGMGQALQYPFPETLTFGCINDSYSGSATVNNENFQVLGGSLLSDVWAYNWPGGSGTSTGLTVDDPTQSSAGGNLLYNSNFATFTTSNVPDNWTIALGSAGTNVFQDTTNPYTGSSDLKITGDAGGTLTALTQKFNTSPSSVVGAGGTPAVLDPATPYSISFWYRVSATPSAGALEVSLIDANGNTLNDPAGTPNLTVQTLTGTSTTYLFFSTVFRLPNNPSTTTPRLKIRLSTAIDNGKSVYVAQMAMSEMTQLYAGGPFASIIAAKTPFVLGDTFTVGIGNTFGVFQSYFARAFGMNNLGLILPNSNSPTISDSLVA